MADVLTLQQYIDENYSGNKSAFARAVNITPQYVSRLIKGDFIVFDGKLYSVRSIKLADVEGAENCNG